MDSPGHSPIFRKNPRANAGFLSVFSFAWTFELLQRGQQRDLTISDLCKPLPEHSSKLLGDKFQQHWKKESESHEQNPKRRPSLIRVIAKEYYGRLSFYFLCTFFNEFVVRLSEPFMLANLLRYFAPNTTVTRNEAVFYASGVVLCELLNTFIYYPNMLAMTHLGMKIRVGLCSLVYRKTLRLSKEASSKIGAGKLVNILSNDASHFDNLVAYMMEAFVFPVSLVAMAWLMWREVEIPVLGGVLVFVLIVTLQGILARKMATLRKRVASRTDYRIRLMSEIVAGIQLIKMYAWENSFAKRVTLARTKEVQAIRRNSLLFGFFNTVNLLCTKLAVYVSLLAYAYYGNLLYDNHSAINASIVYFILQGFTSVENTLVYIPTFISYAAEAYASVRRIETFLINEEAIEAMKENRQTGTGDIEIEDVTATWSKGSNENTLKNINIKIPKGSLVAVIGTMASGKSSLLQMILRELSINSGNMQVRGTVSYASQEPWLFGGTLRQNILFGLPMDEEKYRRVVRVCALDVDFQQLSLGDRTAVGDIGVGLSGGQRARINLARAVYRDADIYLLDDPLSAVDTHISRQLFDECICGYLAGKTVILATHHVQLLTGVGHVIKMDNGMIAEQGSFKELVYTEVDMPPAEDASLVEDVNKTTSVDPATQDAVSEQVEMSSTGSVKAFVYIAYLKAVNCSLLVVVVTLSFILVTVARSGDDYWVSKWVNFEEYGFPENVTFPLLGELNRSVCIIVYSVIIGFLIYLGLMRSFLYYIMCLRSSVNLNSSMFNAISHATMEFFNQTPTGQILNRFSRDTGIVDETLPKDIDDFLQSTFMVLGYLVIITTVKWYLMLTFVIVVFVVYLLRKYYLATSRSIMRVESVTRSPIYTHSTASLRGLLTVRAMGAEARLQQEFDLKMDVNSSAWYYRLGTNFAFGFYINLFCCFYIFVVTFSFLVLDMQLLGGDVGLSITQSLMLTTLFQWAVRQSVVVENNMVSVERLCEYSKVESENQNLMTPADRKLHNWPSQGAIEFRDVTLSYDLTKQLVLKRVTLTIKAGEKIGIVGRSGAGKSSLIATLFRLYKFEGKIFIDGIETDTIGLQDLRSKLSIIPQDPVIFSGTARFNLDPFDEFTDSDLWNVLAEVGLKAMIQDTPGGLLTNLSEGGVNLSVGQRQLVCLARAILRNSKILILDEATANVDTVTDDFIQAAIRKRFAHCTVITIAHRLHSVMDSDRILVMDNGKVVEFGPPQVLMSDPKGHFTSMVGTTGPLANVTELQKP